LTLIELRIKTQNPIGDLAKSKERYSTTAISWEAGEHVTPTLDSFFKIDPHKTAAFKLCEELLSTN